ncbi:MAG: hypothetical protein J6X35_11415, partial [Bacteroidales bacterium]|nr:hypothetical protein [Bacteroidales bacterium]
YASYSRALVANNEVRVTGNGPKYPIYINGSNSCMDVLHNSVYGESKDTTAYGIYLSNSNDSRYSVNVTRNIAVCNGVTSYPLYLSNSNYAPGFGLREWNNLYSKTNVGYAGGARTSVSVLQGITCQDSNTVSIQPSFVRLQDGLELNDYKPFVCPASTLVTTDLNGNPRDVSFTSMGCYGAKMWDGVNLLVDKFTSPAAVTEVTCFGESTPVVFVVRNMGRSAADFASTALRVDVDVTGAVNLHYDTVISTGTMTSARTMDLLFNMPVRVSGTYHIKAKLAYKDDVLSEDDTLSMDYTIHRIQPPYDVNFSTVPAELINVRNAGSVDWAVVHDSAMVSAFGTGRLQFAGAGNPGASASAVFNAVDIQGCINPVLSFWYAHGVSSGIRDVLYVFATTDGGASYTTIGRITPNDTTTGWQQYDIDLSRFANASCLSIVFQAISFGGADQSIDRIRISADADAAITLLPVELGTLTACNNDAVPLRAVIANQTALPFAYSSDTVTAEVTGTTTQSFSYVYNKKLGGYETDTVTLGNMDLRANGNYYVNVYMQSQDDNAQNDTVSDSTLHIWQ